MAWRTGKDAALGAWRGGLPWDPRERALSGHQPPDGNLGHESDPFGAFHLTQSLETAAAVSYALDGNESDGTIPASTGHAHDEGIDTYLGWLQLGSWMALTNSALSSDLYYNSAVVESTSDTPIALIPLVIPAGGTRVIVRAEVAVDTNLGADIKLRLRFFRTGGTINTAALAIDGGHLCRNGAGSFFSWLESAPIELSGVPLTSGQLITWLRVDASVSAGTSYLRQIQVVLPQGGARVTDPATLDTSAAAPDATLTGATLQSVYKTNVENLTDAIYGTTRPTPRVVTPHDHGQGGGLHLDRAILSMSYGPHVPEGSASITEGTWGLPINVPDTSVDFSATPKILAQHGVFIPGGVANVALRVACQNAGDASTLKVEIRPREESGYATPGAKTGVASSSLSFTTAGGLGHREATATLDLTTLGGVDRDRVFEMCVWQLSNPSTSVNRLLGLIVLNSTAPTFLPDSALGLPREEVPISKIREGQEVSTSLTGRGQTAYNQTIYAALGGVPGLDRDLHTPLTDDPWRRLLVEPHQHRGVDYTDPVTGARVNDGAIVRLPLFCAHHVGNVSGNATEDTSSDANPVRGILGTGAITGTGTRLTVATASLPRGLGAFDVYALLQPGTDESHARGFCFVNVRPIARRDRTSTTLGDEITGTIRCGRFRASGVTNSSGTATVQIDPIDGPVWQRNSDRLSRGLGLWTADAKLRSAELPDGTSSTNAARWTQPIRVEITPSDTMDHQIQIWFAVQLGPDANLSALNIYDEDLRVLAVLAVPSAGY